MCKYFASKISAFLVKIINGQTVLKSAAIIHLSFKSSEMNGDNQEMATMLCMLMLIIILASVQFSPSCYKAIHFLQLCCFGYNHTCDEKCCCDPYTTCALIMYFIASTSAR